MTLTNVSIIDSLLTGSLGQISIGDRRHHVGLVLGQPSDMSDLDDDAVNSIWKYGNVEFHFEHNTLTLIHADADELFFGGSTLSIDSSGLSAGMKQGAARRLLESQGIKYNICQPSDANAPEMEIAFDSGFKFGFVLDSNAGLGEDGLRSWSIKNAG